MEPTTNTELKTDRHWMSEALKLAKEAYSHGEVPVGCIIVKDGVVIGSARNETEERSDVKAHAEMLAIDRACHKIGNKYLTGCTLYVTLEPCPMCAGAIVWSKVDRVVFAALDHKAGACGTLFNIASSPLLNHRVEILHGVFEKESEDLLKSFFQSRR
jgi:tRNA(adenine34) deaminase